MLLPYILFLTFVVLIDVLKGSAAGATFHLSARDAIDRLFGGFRGFVDVLVFTPQVNAAKTTEGTDFENVDLGGYLGLIRREGGVGSGRDFHREQAVAWQDHVSV